MKLFYPDYYKKFKCIAGACPDSCCKEWEVDVDEQSAAFYRSLPGALGDRLRQVLRTEDGAHLMTIENGRCPMWRNDGLCRIQAELGHDALCHTCREFPRLRHDYGDFVELGLELSCPEAARLIFSGKHLLCVENVPGGDAGYDPDAMTALRASRSTVLEFLNSTSLPLPQALTVVLMYAHQVQGWVDGDDAPVFDPEACLEKGRQFAKNADLHSFLDFFGSLEILTDRWKLLLEQGQARPWSNALFPLAIYMVERYWLQAVSDYDLIGRVKLMICACILVNALGGDPVQTAQLFSKEIENDADNIEAILDGVYTSPALTDLNLLGLLV